MATDNDDLTVPTKAIEEALAAPRPKGLRASIGSLPALLIVVVGIVPVIWLSRITLAEPGRSR